MPSPFEVIAGPIQAWVAPLATAFPDLDEAPAAAWILLGANGDKNITDDGLTIRHTREVEVFRGLGTTGPRKTFPTEEDMEIEFTLADMTVEVYDKALGAPATAAGNVTTQAPGAGAVGYKTRDLLRGFNIDSHALLVRCGMSPYGDDFTSQWEIPMVQQNGEPELVFTKGVPVGLHFMYRALEDPTLGFGNVKMQNAAAS